MLTCRDLFKPSQIGCVELRNRIAFAPIATQGLVVSDGTLTQRALDFYTERAKGGVGLVITGVAKVENEIEKILPGSGGRMMITPYIRPCLGELAEAIHYYGGRVFVQLTAGHGRNSRASEIVSASEVPCYWNEAIIARALTIKEIKEIVKAFRNASRLLRDVGVDGIELHGHEGYLLDTFTTAIWNKRNDHYGGDLRNRLNFPFEILDAIKGSAGKNFPVIYRFGLKHYIKDLRTPALKEEQFKEAGRDIEEGIEMAKLLEKAGFDALDVDAGCYDSWYWAHPPIYQEHGCLVELAEKVKNVVSIPVIVAGRLDIPELADAVIRENKADIIALGRPLLADPYWPKKVRNSKIQDIRPCIACHEACLQRIVDGKPVSCAVNPAAGRERLYKLGLTDKPKKIIIAGGGVAGMEAARVASMRGHNVKLYERDNELGGHLIEAKVPDFKKDIQRLLDWYRIQLEKLDLEIKTGEEVTLKLVRDENPDIVIVASGSTFVVPEIPGIDNPKVISSTDLLLSNEKIGKRVVIMGGGMIGSEIALYLAKQGKEVTIVEMLAELAMDGALSNRQMLLDLLKFNDVKIETDTKILRVEDNHIETLKTNFDHSTIKYDNLIVAAGLKPRTKLYDDLVLEFLEVYPIGDCKKPGKIFHAIWDGYHIGCAI